jgi:GPH family glycoside/pentoside/hexuronide:cation symporter
MLLNRAALFAYGLFGLPLALVALPIYVYVPQFYAERFGMSLAAIGAALLAARMFDAFIDPALGLWIDRRKAAHGYGYFILLALAPLAIGFVALFHPPAAAGGQPFAWFLASLLLVYVGFSLATIAHQSWGAALTQARGERARLTGTREACGLVGVLVAAALPSVAGIGVLSTVFVVTLLGSAALLMLRAPRPAMPAAAAGLRGLAALTALAEPFRDRRFRWLFAVFVVNGIAAAIPATLFLFFAKDRLQLGQYAGLFLVLYFAAAAVSLPLWVALARRRGEAWTWTVAMLLAIAAFAWVYALPAGAATGFGIICVMSGFALGADLALPPALLAAVIVRAGHGGTREGAYFGAWSWATKMNLALAAGVALPLLQRLGYVPGTVDAEGTQALRIGYALLPCGLKLLAAGLLWRAPLKDL